MTTTSDAALAAFKDHLALMLGRSPHTVRSYVGVVEAFYAFLDSKGHSTSDLNLIDHRIIRAYLANLAKGHSKATMESRQAALKVFFSWLQEERKIVRSPMEKIANVKVTKGLPSYLNEDEVAKLVDAIPTMKQAKVSEPATNYTNARDHAIIATFYSTGMRVSELTALNWQDIDFKTAHLRVNYGKNGRDRILPIGEKANRRLWEYAKLYESKWRTEAKGVRPVFVSRNNQRITTR
jgi:integrase/recombinase XerC